VVAPGCTTRRRHRLETVLHSRRQRLDLLPRRHVVVSGGEHEQLEAERVVARLVVRQLERERAVDVAHDPHVAFLDRVGEPEVERDLVGSAAVKRLMVLERASRALRAQS
jgi:hypothetical protein